MVPGWRIFSRKTTLPVSAYYEALNLFQLCKMLVVFGLLILSRIPAFIHLNLDAITIVSTIVELGFFIWGIIILRK
jgi:hypothetical protein